MADRTNNPSGGNPFAGDAQQWRITSVGMSALKPIMQLQVSVLRMWADSIERLAGNYQQGFEETETSVKKQSDKERAA